jgi:hypothetical protein
VVNEVNRIARKKRSLQDGLPDDRMLAGPVTRPRLFLERMTRSMRFPLVTASYACSEHRFLTQRYALVLMVRPVARRYAHSAARHTGISANMVTNASRECW